MATNFEPHECLIFLQFTKIGTHKDKAIHSIVYLIYITKVFKYCKICLAYILKDLT